MIAIVSDTHGDSDPQLTGRTQTAVHEADGVVHAGDFTTPAVYEAFADVADRLVAVAGNSDGRRLRERLPAVATCEWAGTRFVVTHGHEYDETRLSLLARQEDADLIVVGHTHRPTLSTLDGRLLVNPGSYADPRGNEAAHAEVHGSGEDRCVRLVTPAGTVLSEVSQ